MNERRGTIRVPVGIEGTFQLLGDLSGPRLGMTEDISLGGMRFSSGSRLPPGEKVAVSLNLPREGQVAITGVVVWSREAQESGQENFESGLRWLFVDAHAQARLNAFITDYTRSRAVSVSSSGMFVAPPVNWIRAAVLSTLFFAVGLVITFMWFNQTRLQIEADSLRTANRVYENLIRSYAPRNI